MPDVLTQARAAHARRDWPQALTLFTAAGEQAELSADDLDALSDAHWWLGMAAEALATCEAAYHGYLHEIRPRKAAMTAMQIAYLHFLRGAGALGSGWLGTASRLLADSPECVEHGYLTYIVDVEAALDGPDLESVCARARQVAEIGRRHDDPNLVAVATAGHGRALARQGRVREGIALLDEAMVAVLAGELSPEWAGNIYCNLVASCYELADLGRMWSWTRSLADWCAAQPAAVLFTGICRVHQAQLMKARGAWREGERVASQVCTDLAGMAVSTTAEAHYVLGELRRLNGDFPAAEVEYRAAHELGRDPQPGLAQLRLAQGKPEVAARSIEAALTGAPDGPLGRARLCAAQVEIALAAGTIEVARKASEELDVTASSFAGPGLRAMAEHARGAVLLAAGHPAEALPALRQACRMWRELDACYECARVRLLLAVVYDALDDTDSATRERDAVAAASERLGIALDVRSAPPGGLSTREVEVLSLVSAGKSNREIAEILVLSPKTVSRHLSNIFIKIGVSSRTEAAAYAFAHELTRAPP